MDFESFEKWMYAQGYAKSTMTNSVNLLKGIEDRCDIDELDDLDIADFLYKANRTNSAKNNVAKAINRYLKFRGREFRLKLRPKKGVKDIWVPTEKQKRELMNVRLKTAYMTAKVRLLIRIFFETGARSSEARCLQYEDFRSREVVMDGKKREVFYCHILGKGNKERQVPVSQDLIDKIKTYRKWYGSDSPFIFFNPYTGEPLSPAWVRRKCGEAGKITGVIRFHPHSARHYRTLEWDSEGFSLNQIRILLGHEGFGTLKTYLSGARKSDIFKTFYEKDVYFKEEKNEAGKKGFETGK